ncbi:hypothetical protein ACHAXR_013359 [Thalassiosira sp. AJA248-18]
MKLAFYIRGGRFLLLYLFQCCRACIMVCSLFQNIKWNSFSRFLFLKSQISSEDWARKYQFDDILWPTGSRRCKSSLPSISNENNTPAYCDSLSALALAAVEDVVMASSRCHQTVAVGGGGTTTTTTKDSTINNTASACSISSTVICAVGGTSSGKTRTMFGPFIAGLVSSATRRTGATNRNSEVVGGDTDDLGLVGDIISGILSSFEHDVAGADGSVPSEPVLKCTLSILEIADDEVLRDILASTEESFDGLDDHGATRALRVRHLDKRGAVVLNLRDVAITTMEQLHQLLHESFHSKSLRQLWGNEGGHGHFIATISVATSSGEECGKIQLVDLASPDCHATSSASSRRTGSVRKSLSALRGVLRGIITQHAYQDTTSLIPYRESTLTKLLQRGLEDQGGGVLSPRAVVIGTVCPSTKNYNQTMGTMDFMTRLLAKQGGTAQSPFDKKSLLTANKAAGQLGERSRFAEEKSSRKDSGIMNILSPDLAQRGSQSPYRSKSSMACHSPSKAALKSITSDPRQRLSKLLKTAPLCNNKDSAAKGRGVGGTVRNTTQDDTPKNSSVFSDEAADANNRFRDSYGNVFAQLDTLMSYDDDSVDRNSYGEEIMQALTPFEKAGGGRMSTNGESSIDSSEGLAPSPFVDNRTVGKAGVNIRLGQQEQERKQHEDQQRLHELFNGAGLKGNGSNDGLVRSLFQGSTHVPAVDSRPLLHTEIEFHRHTKPSDSDGLDISSSILGNANDLNESYHQPDTQSNFQSERRALHQRVSATRDHHSPNKEDIQAIARHPDSVYNGGSSIEVGSCAGSPVNKVDDIMFGQHEQNHEKDVRKEDDRSIECEETTPSKHHPVNVSLPLHAEIDFHRQSKPNINISGNWNRSSSTLGKNNHSDESIQAHGQTEQIKPYQFRDSAQDHSCHEEENNQGLAHDPTHPFEAEPSNEKSNDRNSTDPLEGLPETVGLFHQNRIARANGIIFGQKEQRQSEGHGDVECEDTITNRHHSADAPLPSLPNESKNSITSSSTFGSKNESDQSHLQQITQSHFQIEVTKSHQVVNSTECQPAITPGIPNSLRKQSLVATDKQLALGSNHFDEIAANDSVFVKKTNAPPLNMMISHDSMDSEPLVSSRGHAKFFDDSSQTDNRLLSPSDSADAPKSPTYAMFESFKQEIDTLVTTLTTPRAVKELEKDIPVTNVQEGSPLSTEGNASQDLRNGRDGSSSIEETRADSKTSVLEKEIASLKAKVHSLSEEKTASDFFLQKTQSIMNETDYFQITNDESSSWPQKYTEVGDAITKRQLLLITLQSQLELSQGERIELTRELEHAESRVTDLSQVENDLTKARDTIASQSQASTALESEIKRLKEQLEDLSLNSTASSVFFHQLDALLGISNGETSIPSETQHNIRFDSIKSLQSNLAQGLKKLQESLEREQLAKVKVDELESNLKELLRESNNRMESKRLETEKLAEEAISAKEALTNEVAGLQGKLMTSQNDNEALLASHNSLLGDNKKLSAEYETAKSLLAGRDSEISTLKTSFDTCREEKMHLEEQLASIRTKTVGVMKERIEGLKIDYARRLEDFKACYLLEQETEETSRLKLDLSYKEAENANLRRRIDQIEKSTSLKLQNAEERLSQVQVEFISASNEASDQRGENAAMKNELDHLRSLMDIAEESVGQLNRLKEENKQLNDMIRTKEQNSRGFDVPLEIRSSRFTNDNSISYEDGNFVHERISSLMRENEQNNISMRSLQNENVTLKSSIDQCSSTIQLMHSEMNDLKTIAGDGVSKLRKKLENANHLIRSLQSSNGRYYDAQGAGMFSNPNVLPHSIDRLKTPQEHRGAHHMDDHHNLPSRVSRNERQFVAEMSVEKELRFKAEEICAGVLANSKAALEERDSEISKLRSQLFKLSSERYNGDR